MDHVTHLGRYWSARRREVRLIALSAPGTSVDGRPDGVAWDITDALPLAGHRAAFRERYGGRPPRSALWTYRALPCPTVELVEWLESIGSTVPEWATSVEPARLGGERVELGALVPSPSAASDHLVAPIAPRRAQAFGVTYLNSALERETEGRRADYGFVYRSVKERGERPELFLKGTAPEHFVGPGGKMGLRSDLTNSSDMAGAEVEREVVSSGIEPELAACVHSDGRVWGYTLANDVSGNRIENETLLYLYQAKHFTGALVLGPLILLSDEQGNPRLEITTRIRRGDELLFERVTNSERINNPIASLIAWAGSHIRLWPGEVFSTGTDCVPDGAVKVLDEGMTVEISSPAIGRLWHGAAFVRDGVSPNLDYAELELFGAGDGR